MAGLFARSIPARRQNLRGRCLRQVAGSANVKRPGERHQKTDVKAQEFASPEEVLDASALLDVTEFDLFRLAYWYRFGRQPAEAMLETVFAAYMRRGEVPRWVATLCCEVIDQDKRGTLDAEAMGAGRFRDRPARLPHGVLYVGAAMAAWLVLMVCLLDLRPDPQAAAAECRAGQSFYHDWATLIAGRPQSACGR